MPMLSGTTRPIGGKNPFQVIVLDFLMDTITTLTAPTSQSALFLTTPPKSIVPRLTRSVKRGYYKVMMFVCPGRPTNYIRQGDFHFYVQHGVVEYRVKPGDTQESVAKFFKVPLSRVKRAGKFAPNKRLVFRANVFSHKRGWATGPLLTDASGKSITDPRKADRNYPGLNYEKYCSSFCVKDKGIKVGKTHPKVRKKTV
jgi:hypothetical protein